MNTMHQSLHNYTNFFSKLKQVTYILDFLDFLQNLTNYLQNSSKIGNKNSGWSYIREEKGNNKRLDTLNYQV